MKQTCEPAPKPNHETCFLARPRTAHLDSNEDTGFSTELLRSQGFRPASANSVHERSELRGLSDTPLLNIPLEACPGGGAERTWEGCPEWNGNLA